MAPRATWTGYLKIQLITIPVRLYTAVNAAAKVRLNLLHKDCMQRLKQQYVCEQHGKVERADTVKGYEFEKGKYVLVDDDTLATIKLETTKTIEIMYFAEGGAINSVYYNSTYYIGPGDQVAEDAFVVLRDAMAKQRKIAVARLIMTGREHMVTITPGSGGLILQTLHYQDEVRDAESYFTDISAKRALPEQVELFEALIDKQTHGVDLSHYTDRYNEALVDVIKAKVAGEEPPISPQNEQHQISDFMAALKQSVQQGAATQAEQIPKKPVAASVKNRAKKKKKKASK